MKQPEWRTVKARKEWICDGCNEMIKKGDMYDLLAFRSPNFDSKDKQIGIEYVRIRSHEAKLNCHWPEECKKGNHVERFYVENNPESRDYGDCRTYCENCATDLSNIDETEQLKN